MLSCVCLLGFLAVFNRLQFQQIFAWQPHTPPPSPRNNLEIPINLMFMFVGRNLAFQEVNEMQLK